MENSQPPLATDSFSYSWLINNKPSFDGLLESLRPSLDLSSETVPIVHHHHLNKILKDDQDFDFNVHPGSRSSITLVHADEIFSDGCIKPVFVNRDRKKLQNSISVPSTPIPSSVSSRAASACSAYHQGQHYSLKNLKKSPNKVLQRCFGLLRPIYQGLGCSRKSIRVDDLDRKVLEVRSRSSSLQASPDRRTGFSAGDWSALKQTSSSSVDVFKRLSNSPQVSPTRSPSHYSNDAWRDSESSIHEAILHCKRSIAN